jgi:amidase
MATGETATGTALPDGLGAQAAMLADGVVSSAELVTATIEALEAAQPVLGACRTIRGETALREAFAADERIAAGERAPLLGVPVAVKDDTDVAGESTNFGCAGEFPPRANDAELVRRLRAAGAVIVAKTNTPEFGQWPFTEGEGCGITRNPWSPAHTPGGSSGGSAAVVAAGLLGAAVGSDGAGSIRIPASFCGLFGIKPQRGRVPVERGASAGWHGLNHAGPIARTVADAALFLDAIADGGPEGGFATAATREPGRLRVAVSTRLPPGLVARLGREQRAAVDGTADLLRALGHEVVEREIDYGPGAGVNVLTRYLRGIRDEVAAVPHPELLEARTRGMARRGALVPAGAVTRARRAERALAARMQAVLSTADAVLLPGPTGPPSRIGAYAGRGADRTLSAAAAKVPYYGPFNATGQPACSVPAGFDRAGLPLSVQLAGRPHDEATLLSLAAQIERARPWADRRPPL